MNDESPANAHASEGPELKAYLTVFLVLCVFTGVSFFANALLGQNHTSAGIIMVVSVIKAFLVGLIFMHLKSDWGRVYFIIIPVSVMGVMMIIVLLPDAVVAWH